MTRGTIRRLFRLRGRHDDLVERELDEEIRGHLEERARLLEAEGLTPAAARAEALRRFGPKERAREDLLRAARRRERRRGLRHDVEGLRQDARHAVRSVAREPGFAAVVAVVVALGIGANAAMFDLLDRLLLRGPEHVVNADGLHRLQVRYTSADPAMGTFTGSTFGHVAYAALRNESRAFEGAAAWSRTTGTFGDGEAVQMVHVGHATWDFFALLGVRAALGRFFVEAEDRPGSDRLIVLGHGLWQRRFGGDRGIVGEGVSLDGEAYRVIGVAPPGFTGTTLSPVDVWVPMVLRSQRIDEEWRTTWSAQWLDIVVRPAADMTAEQAEADATRVLRAAYTGRGDQSLTKWVLAPLWYDDAGREAMEVAIARWLMALSLIVLLVAGANVANLLLARALRRRREIAVRLALGITRGRLVRMLVAESLVLAMAGGASAVAVAALTLRVVRITLLPEVEWAGAGLDGRLLLFAAVLTLLTGVATGLVPALQSRRGDLLTALKTGVREGGGRGSRLPSWLSIGQAAFSVLLLIAAGLFFRSLRQAENVDLGIDAERVVAVSASWADQADPFDARRARRADFYRGALERARQLDRVDAAAIAIGTPFRSSFTVGLRAEGWDSIPRLRGGGPYVQAVSPGYFETVGLTLRAGRVFEAGEGAGTEHVAIVSQRMAETLWPNGTELGRCLHVGDEAGMPCSRIVGVVENAHRFALEEDPAMQYYIPLGQEIGFGGSQLLLRSGTDAASVVEPLRRALRAVDPEVLWIEVETLQDVIQPQLRPWRMGAILLGLFAALGLAIAAVGLYSLIAYFVASRTHEMGVRMALGADRHAVFALILHRGLVLAGTGTALGIALALAFAPLLSDLLFQTEPRDPVVYMSVAAALLLTGAMACLMPARRATRVDPVRALQAE